MCFNPIFRPSFSNTATACRALLPPFLELGDNHYAIRASGQDSLSQRRECKLWDCCLLTIEDGNPLFRLDRETESCLWVGVCSLHSHTSCYSQDRLYSFT